MATIRRSKNGALNRAKAVRHRVTEVYRTHTLTGAVAGLSVTMEPAEPGRGGAAQPATVVTLDVSELRTVLDAWPADRMTAIASQTQVDLAAVVSTLANLHRIGVVRVQNIEPYIGEHPELAACEWIPTTGAVPLSAVLSCGAAPARSVLVKALALGVLKLAAVNQSADDDGAEERAEGPMDPDKREEISQCLGRFIPDHPTEHEVIAAARAVADELSEASAFEVDPLEVLAVAVLQGGWP